jgi:exosortase A
MKSIFRPAADTEDEARPSAHGPRAVDGGFDAAPAATAAAQGFSLGWRVAWTAYGVAFLATLALFWGTVVSLGETYLHDATFNHGFLILPIIGYLIWLRRDALVLLQPRPTAWAIVPLILAIFGWLAGNAGSVAMVEQFGLLGVLWSLFLGVFGWRIVRTLLFPLFYAVFAIPFGDFLVPPLQDVTAVIAVKGIELVGIPVFSDGLLISIPPGNFEVAEACAGLRFLIATIALGFLFSYLTYKSVWRRAAFLALCVVVPIIANGIRAWGIVFIGYESNMTAAVGFDHIIYGWLFFAIVTAILLAIGISFRDRPIGELPAPGVQPDMRPAVPHGTIVVFAVALTVVAAAGPAYAALVVNRPMPTRPVALVPPQVGNGWRVTDEYRDDWKPTFATADTTLLRTYIKGDRRVHLFIAFYRAQSDGHEVVNYNNRVYDGTAWMRVGSGIVAAMVDRAPLTIEYTRMVQGRASRVAWSWNWVADSYTANPYLAKLLEAQARLFGGEPAAAAIAITTDYIEKPTEAAPVLQDFLNSAAPLRPLLMRAAGR